MPGNKRQQLIRVGVIGVGRGTSFAPDAGIAGMKLVAICDRWEDKLKDVNHYLKIQTYTDYDKFLEHDMDAVILANNFHEHAPFAIKALQAGYHVMSETQACHTLAEGAALARAVEKSGKIYMFAENYPYSAVNQEMRRLYLKGMIGEFKYGEGEYCHAMDAWTRIWLAPYPNHWRNWIPATYYCTHAMAPIMYITETRPVKVSGFIIPYDYNDPHHAMTAVRVDTASMIVCQMNNEALVKLLQIGVRGHSRVRIHGNKGALERDPFTGELHVFRPAFDLGKKRSEERAYRARFPVHRKLALKAGHGGGDFFMDYAFANAIRTGRQPFLDVYRGIDMSIIGILSYRSALNNSGMLEVPDFRKESERKRYERDDWSPDPARRKKGQPWPSVLGNVQPSKKARAYAARVWQEQRNHWGLKPWKLIHHTGKVLKRFTPAYVKNLMRKNWVQFK